MKITIIETGLPPEAIRDDFPAYPAMFESLVGGADPDLSFETVSPERGDSFPDPAGLEGILITGSAYGVYDPVPWMQTLMEFIRWAAEARIPQAGLCFGHQALAQALGGHVAKSDKGWGIGRHAYAVPHKPDWMAEAPDEIAFAVSHQDQVLVPPPGAEIIATNEFCTYAGLHYNHIPVMSFQGHPEFDDAFISALYRAREGCPLQSEAVQQAIDSLADPHHNPEAGEWIARFFRQSAAIEKT